jgi:hypothetical protein
VVVPRVLSMEVHVFHREDDWTGSEKRHDKIDLIQLKGKTKGRFPQVKSFVLLPAAGASPIIVVVPRVLSMEVHVFHREDDWTDGKKCEGAPAAGSVLLPAAGAPSHFFPSVQSSSLWNTCTSMDKTRGD